MPDGLVSRTTSMLRAYACNLANAARWMHPSWIKALLILDDAQFEMWAAAVSRASNQGVRDASLALCRCAGVSSMLFADVIPESAVLKGAEGMQLKYRLLDVCTPEVGLQILCMRALCFRRVETRRIIDKRVRIRLSEWAGVRIDALLSEVDTGEPPDMAALNIRVGAPPLAELDAQALCAEGLALIERDVGAEPSEPLRSLRCALPNLSTTPSWLQAVSPNLDRQGTVRLFESLSDLLPEWKWLFG
jgi:type III secretion system HrpB4-like protein